MRTITIRPVPLRNGKYDVVLVSSGETILRSCRDPFLDGARKLLADGLASLDDRIQMQREGEPVAVSGTVGKAAKLTVRENANVGPVYVRYHQLEHPFDQE